MEAAVPACGVDEAWRAVLAACGETERLARQARPVAFALAPDGTLRTVADRDPAALIGWRPDAGWEARVDPGEPGHVIFELYLPLCNATAAAPVTVGHLGQSLDGFIATHGGDSQFVTGHENIVHLHRLRALCDAVVVGAGTVAADDPQLTTRLVPGPSPLRVVFDPARRLDARYRLFHDDATPTMYVCARPLARDGESHIGNAEIVAIDTLDATGDGGLDEVAQLQRLLRDRGCHRILVEGGGVTVSKFLRAGLIDRLQVAVAPFIMGEGRPAIRLPAPAMLADCDRPTNRVFRMGDDVMFELVMTARRTEGPPSA